MLGERRPIGETCRLIEAPLEAINWTAKNPSPDIHWAARYHPLACQEEASR